MPVVSRRHLKVCVHFLNYKRIFQEEKNHKTYVLSREIFSAIDLRAPVFKFLVSPRCKHTPENLTPLSGYESRVLLWNPSISHKRLHPRNYILRLLYSVLYEPTGKLSNHRIISTLSSSFLFLKNKK